MSGDELDARRLALVEVTPSASTRWYAGRVWSSDDLRHLHEGNVARYGLRPSEFAAWAAGTARNRI